MKKEAWLNKDIIDQINQDKLKQPSQETEIPKALQEVLGLKEPILQEQKNLPPLTGHAVSLHPSPKTKKRGKKRKKYRLLIG